MSHTRHFRLEEEAGIAEGWYVDGSGRMVVRDESE